MSGLNFLEALIGPAVEAAGYRLVRLRILGGKRKTLQIMAERADGQMDVEDCARLSRAVSQILEADDPMAEDYVLEVSSPGIDRPLSAEADFVRFAGYEVRVEMTRDLDGRKRFKGLLIGVEGRDVLMDVHGDDGMRRVRLPLTEIADAKLVLTDRLIQESLRARKTREEAKASH